MILQNVRPNISLPLLGVNLDTSFLEGRVRNFRGNLAEIFTLLDADVTVFTPVTIPTITN